MAEAAGPAFDGPEEFARLCALITAESVHAGDAETALRLRAMAIAATYGGLVASALQATVAGSSAGSASAIMTKLDCSPVTLADLLVQVVVTDVLARLMHAYAGEAPFERPSGLLLLAEEEITQHGTDVLLRVSKLLNEGFAPAAVAAGAPWSVIRIRDLYSATRVSAADWAGGKSYFILDPIDGTKGYVAPGGDGQWAVGLAHFDGATGVVAASAIACPRLPGEAGGDADAGGDAGGGGFLFLAAKGAGAFAYPIATAAGPTGTGPTGSSASACGAAGSAASFGASAVRCPSVSLPPLHLRVAQSLQKQHSSGSVVDAAVAAVLAAEAARRGGKATLTAAVQMDSMGKLCLVSGRDGGAGIRRHTVYAFLYLFPCLARGDVNLFIRIPSKSYNEKVWDVAPGLLLVEEAGGRVTHADGSPIELNFRRELLNTSGLVATMGRGDDDFHDRVLAAVGKAVGSGGRA